MPPLKPASDKALNALIKNDDRPLNWFVVLIAKKRQVNEFQCRTPEAATKAALSLLRFQLLFLGVAFIFVLLDLFGVFYSRSNEKREYAQIT